MLSLTLTSRDVEISDSMTTLIQECFAGVERLVPTRNGHCEVILSKPHSHHRKGRIHHVHLHLKIGTREIFVDRETEKTDTHANFALAVKDAFRTLEARVKKVFSKRNDLKRGTRKLAESREEEDTSDIVDLAMAVDE